MASDDLIKRLEEAKEGSRELDAEIHVHLVGPDLSHVTPIYGMVAVAHKRAIIAPQYTTSIDAALTLVPEGAGWVISKDLGRKATAVVFDGTGSHLSGPEASGTNVRAALALCAAALKARQA